MLVIVFALSGAVFGGWLAKKRGGLKKDIAQYAAGYAIMWAVIGLIATLVLDAYV